MRDVKIPAQKRVEQPRNHNLSCEPFWGSFMKMQMSYAVRFLILSATFSVGCRTAHNVAVSSFRVIDAPANYVRRHIEDEGPTTTTTSTTTYQSDAVTPGQPIVGPAPSQRQLSSQRRAPSNSDVRTDASTRENVETKPKSSPSSSQPTTNSSGQNSKIPYAKPVPGKPGYVYSPFDPNGGYVDVTGYAPGSKAKDPYSGKIFIVP